MVHYLTAEEVLTIHAEIIEAYGGSDGVRDLGLLESAVARPRAGFGAFEAYPTLFEKAAVLLHSLIWNHAFIDGNKRTGTAATIVFLERNGVQATWSVNEFVMLTLDVAEGRLTEPAIADWLEGRTTTIRPK